MNTRRQLATLLVVSVGGLAFLAVVAVGVLTLIRRDISRLSEETTPVQIKLAKLQRGFERVNAGFARISSAATSSELEAIQQDTARALDEIGQTARDLAGRGQGVDSRSLDLITGIHEQLRKTGRDRIESRLRLEQVYQGVAKEIESVTAVTQRLSKATDELQGSSQDFLQKSKKTTLETNATIKEILVVREKTVRLWTLLLEVRAIEQRFRLNVQRDKAQGVLESFDVRRISDKALAGLIDQFAKGFAAGFEGKGGLLELRGAAIASPNDANAKAAFEGKLKSLSDMVDALGVRITEAIDPMELAVVQANRAMNQATIQIAQASLAAAAAAECNARGRTVQAVAWQLLLANEADSVSRLVEQIGVENAKATRLLADLERQFGELKRQAEVNAVRQAVVAQFENLAS